MTAPRRLFVARYRAGLLFAPGPAVYLAPMLALPTLVLTRNIWAALGAGLLGFIIAAALWTSLRRRAPALALAEEGMRLEGLPLQAWSQIDGIRPVLDERGRPAIEVRLRRVPPPSRSPLWRASGRHTIIIQATLLDDPPPDIEEAFEYFLTHKVS